MTAPNYLLIIAIGLFVIGWETRVCAEGDVTIYTAPAAVTNAPPDVALAPDGTPVVHKSFHKKKTPGSDTFTASTTDNPVSSASIAAMTPTTPTKTTPAAYWTPAPNPVQTIPPALVKQPPVSFGPTVETALPIARHHGDEPVTSDAAPIPIGATLPAMTSAYAALSHASTTSSSLPAGSTRVAMASPMPPLSEIAPIVPPSRLESVAADYVSSSYIHKGPKNVYPWKTNIITTFFWIGEPGSAISSTDNIGSAWDEDWRASNGGSDSPYNRNGILPAYHAATVNPFYVALPFNDLAFPDKAREWLPPGWYRSPKNGKQISACKDRWVEIKVEDGTGRFCYAQWEDVGPLRYDHAEYVFGPERPNTYTRAGLDVSPAVWEYLNLTGKDHVTTRWRFVDDENVPPGAWLRYEEQAVLFQAIKNAPWPGPVDDSSTIDSNKKKVGAAKG